MPISKDQARGIIERISKGASLEALKARLRSVPEAERPFAPDVPRPSDATAEGRDARRDFLRGFGVEIPALSGELPPPDPELFQGNVELFIGMAQVPVGLAGPLRINGLHAHGDYHIPLATTEGALVASYHRGARIATRAGGIACVVTAEQVQRAPAFLFDGVADATHFAAWVTGEFERCKEVAATRTSHGELIDLQVQVESRSAYVILAFYTGDASGQNMVTFCSQAICEDLLARAPVQPRSWYLESNMSGDKKATVMSFQQTRGRRVIAEVTLPRVLVERGLHTTPEKMCEYWRLSFIAGVQTGSIGVSGHVANGIAAMFIATGQDAACVSEASVGLTHMETTPDGGLYCGLDLPNLIVGTVGGGTGTPTARECLRILRCEGDGKAAKFAEIVAGTLLAGEISIIAAISAGHFASAHERLGRRPRA
ncbi:MAG: hydroxymethylglutaryl-CoA reductase [Candidatus Eisenbacteria bacterium]